ncbi:hypothetical protein SAMN06298226_1098 [Nitrosovibrio sp. Nv4]|nr:hypothetical protein SAMN06298226_1098 [Nitrosovibrio sp. Nv4]
MRTGMKPDIFRVSSGMNFEVAQPLARGKVCMQFSAQSEGVSARGLLSFEL